MQGIYVYIIYVGFIVCWGQTYTYFGGLMEFNSLIGFDRPAGGLKMG
jgi:hypothetical protein